MHALKCACVWCHIVTGAGPLRSCDCTGRRCHGAHNTSRGTGALATDTHSMHTAYRHTEPCMGACGQSGPWPVQCMCTWLCVCVDLHARSHCVCVCWLLCVQAREAHEASVAAAAHTAELQQQTEQLREQLAAAETQRDASVAGEAALQQQNQELLTNLAVYRSSCRPAQHSLLRGKRSWRRLWRS